MSAASGRVITYTNISKQGCKAARANSAVPRGANHAQKTPLCQIFFIKTLLKSCVKGKSKLKLSSSNEHNLDEGTRVFLPETEW